MILDASTPDPGSTGLWGFLGLVVTTVLAPVIVGRATWKRSRPPEAQAPAAPSPEREHVEACHGVPTADMSDSLVKIIARMDERFERQSERMQTVERRWDEARDEVSTIHDWIDDGCPDPPGRPERPAWAPSRRTIH